MLKNIIKIMVRDFMVVKNKYFLMITLSFIMLTMIDIFLAHDFTDFKLLLGVLAFQFTIFQLEDEAKFEKIKLSLPVSRSTQVIARYFEVIVIAIISGIIVTIIHNILINFNLLPISHAITLKRWFVFIVSCTILFSIFLTMYYKFGNYKDSIPYSIMFFLPIAVLATYWETVRKTPWTASSQIALIIGLVITYFSSMMLAIRFYNKREV